MRFPTIPKPGTRATQAEANAPWPARQRSATDGPFTETKELLGAFTVLEAKSRRRQVTPTGSETPWR